MSWIYFFAFSSLYIQLPGLYGTNGVVPVHALENNVPKDFADFLKSPSILRFAQLKQLSLYDSMEIMIIVNVVLSLFAILFSSFRCFTSFSIFWISYLSIYQYGQVFLYFQWDSLLLEAGFLCILMAQSYFFIVPIPRFASSDSIVIWLFKWLLFRLMFASGIVKLQSNCPTWWSLSALNYHFQSQCIPTPAAYYFHNLPMVLLHLGVVATFVIEVIVPFLFFLPLRGIRLFSFYTQVMLQVMIIITGNYNFFNLLTIVLCYALLEDEDFGFRKASRASRRPTTLPGHILSVVLIFGVFFVTYNLTHVTRSHDSITGFQLAFSKKQLDDFVLKIVPKIIYLATLFFGFKLLSALAKAVTSEGCMRKMWNLSMVLFIGMISVCVFTCSIISIGQLEKSSLNNLPKEAIRVYQELDTLQLTSSYGLFRRMTGVPKRPEIILEGAMSDQGPWTKFEFHHKPTEMSKMPSIVAPHQPRLDWQMWFAALSNPEDNPWLYNVIYRILSGEKSVIELLESLNMKEKPKFIRASLFDYEFSDQNSSKTWWTRTRKSIYINPLSLQSPELTKVVTKNGLLKKPKSVSTRTILIDYKDLLREKIGQPKDLYPAILVIALIKATQALLLR